MAKKAELAKLLQATLVAGDVQINPTSLVLDADMEMERWMEIGDGLRRFVFWPVRLGAAASWWK